MKRFLPLVCLVALIVLVFAMGWHRMLSLDMLRERRAMLVGFVMDRFMLAVAVRGFAEQDIRVGRCAGIVQDRLAVTADITGKHYNRFLAILGNGERQAGGAENVPRVVRFEMKFGRNVEATRPRHRRQQLQHRINVLRCIERFAIASVASLRFALRALGIFFLQVRGVFQ